MSIAVYNELNTEVQNVLKKYFCEVIDDASKYKLRSEISTLLHKYFAMGKICGEHHDELPIIDVNDELEVRYIKAQLQQIMEQAEMTHCVEEMTDELKSLQQRLMHLMEKACAREPTEIVVDYKHPDTMQRVGIKFENGMLKFVPR